MKSATHWAYATIFKSSSIYSLDGLNSKTGEATIGSVMDYWGVNIAPEGQEQGHYFTPTIGPWDYWVIEYAYKPIDASNPEGELKGLGEIASRAATPELTYGTDEDVIGYRYRDLDPLVNLWDLGADPLEFAKQRREIVAGLWDKIADKVTKEGMGYQRVRQAFGRLLYEHANTMYLACRYIGGQAHHRDHRGDENGRLPFAPVPAAKQREALQFLKEYALSDKAFDFPADLLNSLAITRWSDWGSDSWNAIRFDYPVHGIILRNQAFILERLLYPTVLSRVQDTELKFAKGEDAFTLPELFSGITDAVWMELGRGCGCEAVVELRYVHFQFPSRSATRTPEAYSSNWCWTQRVARLRMRDRSHASTSDRSTVRYKACFKMPEALLMIIRLRTLKNRKSELRKHWMPVSESENVK